MIGIGVQGYSFVQFLTIVIEGYPYGQVGFHQLIACCWSGVHFFHWRGTFVTRGFLAKVSQGLLMLIVVELQFVVCSFWRVLGHNGHTLLVIDWLQGSISSPRALPEAAQE